MSAHGLSAGYIINQWRGHCDCGVRFSGDTYEAFEDEWRRHVYDVLGQVPNPISLDETVQRWSPEVAP